MPDQRRDQPTISFPLPGGRGTHSYNTWEAMNSGFWASKKPPKDYRNCHSWNDGEVQFGTGSKVGQDESGICSPPLWTISPPRSPQSRRNYYRSLSPASKTQAIERGQRELMEMVRTMPESTYELSLKDLVEHPRVDVGEENRVGERNKSKKNAHMREGGNSRNVDRKGQGKGSGKIENGGFYLKMVFPNYLISKKKKNEANQSLKVSPRSSVSDGPAKALDKEWWKKSHPVSGGESDSGVSSINTGSAKSSGSSSSNSSRSNSRHEMSGSSCWPFVRRPESISQK